MKNNLRLIEDSGYILTIDVPPKRCVCCRKELVVPYFFCDEYSNGRCKPCERRNKDRTCGSKEIIHEHFNIIEVKQPLLDKIIGIFL